jgi:hypothetical protein
MRHHYPRSRRTLVPAALRKADTLTLEITCTVHVITSLRYFSPLLLRPLCPSWPRPDRRKPASRSASTINSTRIITTGTTTKIAPGVNTSPKTTETLTNIQSPISGSNRNTGTGATPILTIAIIKTDTSLIPSIPSATSWTGCRRLESEWDSKPGANSQLSPGSARSHRSIGSLCFVPSPAVLLLVRREQVLSAAHQSRSEPGNTSLGSGF